MRMSRIGGAVALVLAMNVAASAAAAVDGANDPQYQRFEDSYANEDFEDCGAFGVGWDLDFVSELVTWDDQQLGRFEHHYTYWRSTDHAALGSAEIHQTGLYKLGDDGAPVEYTLLGPATYTMANGRVLQESGAITRGADDAIVWQAGEHPDIKAALCEVGAALP